jgi:hypothetical protein
LNFSAHERVFHRFLAHSLATLAREAPIAWNALVCALAGFVVQLRINGEPLYVGSNEHTLVVEPGVSVESAVQVVASHAAILRLVDGKSTLLEAIMRDELDLIGRPADVARFHDSLVAYVHGAVRSRSHRRLLADYRLETETLR